MARRGRARRQRREAVPKWAWGIGPGAIVGPAIGGYFLVTETGGGDGGTCDRELSPLGASEISQNAFDERDASLTSLIALLNAGGRADDESDFFAEEMHNFTHNIDPAVRQQDPALARELCEAVIVVEDAFPSESSSQIAQDIARMQDPIRDSAEALGYDRPG
jgi:hypothetical protein